MDVSKETTLDALTIDQVLVRIRIDPETGKGSVLDVVQLITGKFGEYHIISIMKLPR